MKSILAAFAALLLSAAPALAEAPAPVFKAAKPALWVVRDADTILYLFGTVHVLRPGIRWFEGPVKQAFDAAGELRIEMVEPDAATVMAKVQALAIDPQKRPLSGRLDPAARTAYGAALASLKLPAAVFDAYEPWFAGMTMGILPLQAAGFTQASGVEAVLTAAARAAAKSVTGLEKIDEQLGYFDGLPEPDQIAFLNATVKALPDAVTDIDTLIDLWSRGKTRQLAAQMNKEGDLTPALYTLLLKDRNARWADWVKARLATPGTVFIAVGSGHLAGPDSVQAMLKARHVKTKRLQ